MNLNKIVKLGSETRLLKKDFRITEKAQSRNQENDHHGFARFEFISAFF